jgi:hypothetical protein
MWLGELVPSVSKIAILANPGNLMHRLTLAEEVPRAARNLGVAFAGWVSLDEDGLRKALKCLWHNLEAFGSPARFCGATTLTEVNADTEKRARFRCVWECYCRLG